MNELLLAFSLATHAFGLPPGLIDSVCFVESSYNVRVVHIDDGGSNSIGLCQLKLSTARLMGYRGSEYVLKTSPSVNAYYAAKYLRHQLYRYDGDISKAVSAYNLGSYRANSRGLSKNYNYVAKVYKVWDTKNSRGN